MKSARPRFRTSSGSEISPQLGFAAAVVAGFFGCFGSIAGGWADAAMPIMTTLLLLCAAGFALIAWRGRDEESGRVTYADVAGALTLIGLFAAASIDPDQLLRMVAAERIEN